MNKQYTTQSVEDLPRVSAQIYSDFKAYSTFLLVGAMGAGKTTFTKAFIQAMGCSEVGDSPTFSIVNTYFLGGPKVKQIHHFDLYRITQAEELLDIGFTDYLDDETAVSIIEWPQIGEPFYKGEVVLLKITVLKENLRQIEASILSY